MKNLRQKKILDIIGQRAIETQQMLAEAISEAGFPGTQATISRDIRELNLVKELGLDGRYRYASPARGNVMNYSDKLRSIFREGVTSVAQAQNLVVIKTLPGLAPAACSAVDDMGVLEVVGTIAGDDTAFLAMRDAAAAERFCRDIAVMLR